MLLISFLDEVKDLPEGEEGETRAEMNEVFPDLLHFRQTLRPARLMANPHVDDQVTPEQGTEPAAGRQI